MITTQLLSKANPRTVRVLRDGKHLCDLHGPKWCAESALVALRLGGELDPNFEQRHQCEVTMPDGTSPSLFPLLSSSS